MPQGGRLAGEYDSHAMIKPINRIAVLLTSYKRLIELEHQIYTMIHQTWAPAMIYVAVKGYPENFVRRFLAAKFAEFPHVCIRIMPNRNQLANLLDCIRGEDVSQMDYFLKIDDDDHYPRDYIAHVRDQVNKAIAEGRDIHGHGIKHAFVQNRLGMHMNIFRYAHRSFWGGTLGFSPEVLDLLQGIEANRPDALEATEGKKMAVDELIIHLVSRENGMCEFDGRENYVYSSLSPSCWRQRERYLGLPGNIFVSDPASRQTGQEHYFYVIHPGWADTLYLKGDQLLRINKPEQKGRFSLSGNTLSINWEDGSSELFDKHPNGFYIKQNGKGETQLQ